MARQRRRNETLMKAFDEIRNVVAPILCEVRAAYLIDTINVSEPELKRLVTSLRSSNSEIRALRLRAQVFIVHLRLVKELLKGLVDGSYNPILIQFPFLFVCSHASFISLQEISRTVLDEIEEHNDSDLIDIVSKITSPSALAGLLLSYPLIYYSEDVNAKLTDTVVDVYKVQVNGSEPKTVMQFSGPPEYRDIVTKQLDKVLDMWKGRISRIPPSLQQIWQSYTGERLCTLEVEINSSRVSVLTL